MSLSPEQREQCLRRCAPRLEAKADQLRENGHTDAAAILDAVHLHGEHDSHVAGALSVLALEAVDPEDRDHALNAVAAVARAMVEDGDDWNPGPLVTWLDEATAVYGFPSERADN